MMRSSMYKCQRCGAILVTRTRINCLPPLCTKCQTPMTELDENFELTEIIEEKKQKI